MTFCICRRCALEKKTSTFNNALIWFGAGVSIAEILTGTYLAPLGFGKGLLATLLGHGIGCILLFCAGLMGARTGKSSMEIKCDPIDRLDRDHDL